MTTRKLKLDAIDMHILKLLQEDGRMTNVEIAGRVGISAPPCLRRIKSLEKSGYIKNYHGVLNFEMLGFGVVVFCHIKLHNHADTDITSFQNLIESWDEVRESYMLAGDTDFLLKVVSENWDTYQRFLTEKLTSAHNVATVRTSLTIRQNKSLPGAPIKARE